MIPAVLLVGKDCKLDSDADRKNAAAALSYVSPSVLSDSKQHHELWPAQLLCPWDSPGKNTRVGCHFPHVLHW